MAIKFASCAPVFPVRNVTTALEHYRRLGFDAKAYNEADADGPVYGFLYRGAVELHLARVPALDPAQSMSACYLYVDDADALFAQWSQCGVTGRFTAPEDTPYGLREFAHIDGDGNLLRVGSPLRGG